jgi:FKBP-type peptidyl-prolyl cis-trans isomerase (trigger factor)
MLEDWTKAAESSVRIGLGLAEVAKELGKELKNDEDYRAMLDELVKNPK